MQLRQRPQTTCPSPLTTSPGWKSLTFEPTSTISPTNSCPITSGTGIVFCAQASHEWMCRSVPQMPVLRTRISTSLIPTSGSGTSSSQSPGSAFAFTSARTAPLLAGIAEARAPQPQNDVDGRGHHAPARRRGARREHRRRPRRLARRRARARRVPRPRDAARLGRAGGIEFDDAELAREVGVVCLVAILYEGGLSTSWRRLRRVAVPAALLSTVGVAVTALLTGAAAHSALRPRLARVGPPRRGRRVDRRRRGLRDAASHAGAAAASPARSRRETGLNDPIAIALTLGLIDWIDDPTLQARRRPLPDGAAARHRARRRRRARVVATRVFSRLPRSVGSFAPVASVAAAALSFGVADVLGGSGFLAVYLVGLAVGSTPSRYRGQLVTFHEDLAFLAQVTMFVVLGLLVFPSDLPAVMVAGFVLALLLVVRDPAGRGRDRRPRSATSTPASARSSAGPGSRRRADRARDLRPLASTSPRARRSSTRSSSSSSSPRSCRARRSSGSPARSGCSSRRGAVAAAARGRRVEPARPRRVRRRERLRDRRRRTCVSSASRGARSSP